MNFHSKNQSGRVGIRIITKKNRAPDPFAGMDKVDLRREINRLTAEFLSNGGIIQKIKPGVCGRDFLTPAQKRKNWVRF